MAISNVMSSQSISPILHEKHLCQSDEKLFTEEENSKSSDKVYFKRK